MLAKLWPKSPCATPGKMSPCRSLRRSNWRTEWPAPTRLKEKATRRQFLNELMTALPVHPVTVPVALRAGQIDGENTAQGVRVALADLLIGVTALELGYRVATANVRHFQMVPGLGIVSL
jgi:predicted nucleic acid-binding protein